MGPRFKNLSIQQSLDPQFLTSGEIGNWIGKVFQVKRDQVKPHQRNPDVAKPAVYLLVGHTDNGLVAYVGHASNAGKRMFQHLKLPYWQTSFICNSKAAPLTIGDIQSLEYELYVHLKQRKGLVLLNKRAPSKPKLSEAAREELLELLYNYIRLINAMFPDDRFLLLAV